MGVRAGWACARCPTLALRCSVLLTLQLVLGMATTLPLAQSGLRPAAPHGVWLQGRPQPQADMARCRQCSPRATMSMPLSLLLIPVHWCMAAEGRRCRPGRVGELVAGSIAGHQCQPHGHIGSSVNASLL